MDYSELRNTADMLINGFSNRQATVLLKGEKATDSETGKVTKSFREVPGGPAVMANYSEEAIAASGGVIEAGDVKFVCRFDEKPTEVEDRIRYAGVDYSIVHVRPINPTGDYAVAYVVHGRRLGL